MKLGTEVREQWRGLVMEQSQSGQTVSAFCRERGIRDSQFYDWKKRVREGEGATFVEVKVKDSSERPKRAAEADRAIEIRLGKGRSLLVGPGFDTSHLRALLVVLETEA
jgi:transposase-like protein